MASLNDFHPSLRTMIKYFSSNRGSITESTVYSYYTRRANLPFAQNRANRQRFDLVFLEMAASIQQLKYPTISTKLQSATWTPDIVSILHQVNQGQISIDKLNRGFIHFRSPKYREVEVQHRVYMKIRRSPSPGDYIFYAKELILELAPLLADVRTRGSIAGFAAFKVAMPSIQDRNDTTVAYLSSRKSVQNLKTHIKKHGRNILLQAGVPPGVNETQSLPGWGEAGEPEGGISFGTLLSKAISKGHENYRKGQLTPRPAGRTRAQARRNSNDSGKSDYYEAIINSFWNYRIDPKMPFNNPGRNLRPSTSR
ncbi:MAG: hypothetical protein AAFR61_03000 [Bacteroidota bacterium]